jgi:hypothetical protein
MKSVIGTNHNLKVEIIISVIVEGVIENIDSLYGAIVEHDLEIYQNFVVILALENGVAAFTLTATFTATAAITAAIIAAITAT